MKLFEKSFNYRWLLFLLFLIPVLVFATGNAYNGYKVYHDHISEVIYWNTTNTGVMVKSTIGYCVKNNSLTTDYFVPTRTLAEFDSFLNTSNPQLINDLELIGCIGDGVCGAGENCSNAPGDCGVCPSCGDDVCNNDETIDTCPIDCPPVCGDHYCTPDFYYGSSLGLIKINGETCSSCVTDCETCSSGGFCKPTLLYYKELYSAYLSKKLYLYF